MDYDIKKALSICKSERYMREIVFKNKPALDKKLEDIDFVIGTLNNMMYYFNKTEADKNTLNSNHQ